MTAFRQAVQHTALEAQLVDGALQFIGGGKRMRGRKRCKTGEPRRVILNRCVQTVVGGLGPRNGDVFSHALRARRTVRNNLKVDARFIHLTDALGIEIFHAFHQWRRRPN